MRVRMRIHRLGILVLLLEACARPDARTPAIDADSVRDFSGEQGRSGWTYGYWDSGEDADGRYAQAEDFRPLDAFGGEPSNGLGTHDGFTTGDLWTLATPEGRSYYTSVWASGGHPHGEPALAAVGGGEEHWAIRRWTSPSAGVVDVSGHYGRTMPWGTNWRGTVRVRVVADGRTVLDTEAADEREVYAFALEVSEGTLVDFMVGPDTEGRMGVTDFTAAIRSSL